MGRFYLDCSLFSHRTDHLSVHQKTLKTFICKTYAHETAEVKKAVPVCFHSNVCNFTDLIISLLVVHFTSSKFPLNWTELTTDVHFLLYLRLLAADNHLLPITIVVSVLLLSEKGHFISSLNQRFTCYVIRQVQKLSIFILST